MKGLPVALVLMVPAASVERENADATLEELVGDDLAALMDGQIPPTQRRWPLTLIGTAEGLGPRRDGLAASAARGAEAATARAVRRTAAAAAEHADQTTARRTGDPPHRPNAVPPRRVRVRRSDQPADALEVDPVGWTVSGAE